MGAHGKVGAGDAGQHQAVLGGPDQGREPKRIVMRRCLSRPGQWPPIGQEIRLY
jgi:hypothetical protein